MRDPDLVFNAQLAAASLERAWQRWRVVHGLAAGPLPAVSSYVGYSLEEPWGQPRVVFGLAAEEAEQLAALLDRHDCVGPVHAMVTSAGPLSGTDGESGPPLRVPPQTPSAIAERVPAGSPKFAARKAARDARAGHSAGERDDRDGPVFRQVAARAQEAAAARGEVPAPVSEPAGAGPGPGEAPASAGQPGVAEWAEAGVSAAGTGGESRAARNLTEIADQEGASDAGVGGAGDAGADSAGADSAGDAGADSAGEGGADSAGDAGAGGAVDADTGGADQPVSGSLDHQGPLSLAASAARLVAEARIRAALLQSRPVAGLEYPYAGGSFDVTDPNLPGDPNTPARLDARNSRGQVVSGEPVRRPEAASGAQHWSALASSGVSDLSEDPVSQGPVSQGPGSEGPGSENPGSEGLVGTDLDPASAAGADDLAARQEEQDVVPFRPGPGLAAYLDAGPEADQEFDERPDQLEASHSEASHSEASYTRRSRITRGYSIPRLSRTKRSGAVPGA